METRVNYTIVGLFVIIFSSAGISMAIWLFFGVSHKSYDYYYMFVNESVSGLNVKSPVKYSGVEVGLVSNIKLSQSDPELVRVKLAVDQGTPVSVDTRAELDTQGLTGMAYVELSGGKPGSAPLKAKPGQDYPVIKSEPSLLFRLDAALDHVTGNLETISKGLSSALNQKNTEALGRILENLDGFTDQLNENSAKIDSIIVNLNSTLENTSEASKNFPELVQHVNESAESFHSMIQVLTEAGEQVKTTFTNTSAMAENFNTQVVPETVEALDHFAALMQKLRGFTGELEDNPAMLIRGRQALQPGPGE